MKNITSKMKNSQDKLNSSLETAKIYQGAWINSFRKYSNLSKKEIKAEKVNSLTDIGRASCLIYTSTYIPQRRGRQKVFEEILAATF